MAEAIILTPLLNALIGNLLPPALKEIRLLWGVEKKLKKLSKTLSTLQDVLEDAEERQLHSKLLRNWLQRLKDVAYDADDVLDEFAIEALRRKVEGEIQIDERKQVCNLSTCFSRNQVFFRHDIAHKIDEIRERLNELCKERNELHLGERDGRKQPKIKKRPHTGSLIDKSYVFGREDDKRKLVTLLVSKQSHEQNISVISVVGMGGLGKTTVVQLVYNDEKIDKYFDLRIWVCVSEDFDVERLTKSIINSATKKTCNLEDIDPLQVTLKAILTGKRFLLILDDVWNENYHEWERLRLPLIHGAKGSKIVVTTRSYSVSMIMDTTYYYHLETLSKNDCWSLFKQRAFREENIDLYPKLEEIGRKIVEKCQGLPLTAKTLGGLLSYRRDESHWQSILNSEIWELPKKNNDILPALRLSYHHLTAHVKQCFAYFSIFPKDYEFKKIKLVELWMAEGFIHPDGNRQMEDIGSEYFDDLLLASFIQYSHEDNRDGESIFKMHDLIHDVAQSVAYGEIVRNEEGKPCIIPEMARHSSLIWYSTNEIPFEAFYESKSLRTFVWQHNQDNINQVPNDLFLHLKRLRVLDFSDTNICELPNSIENLKHLRYLNLSTTNIRKLPESVSNLYSLQILKLDYCHKILELPQGIGNLINLRHLGLVKCSELTSMPLGIGRLTCLQKLSRFVVDKEGGCGIGELKNMTSLQGEIYIIKLENVVNVDEAKNANMKNKVRLHKLKFEWSDYDKFQDGNEEEVLESLQPHFNLKELSIKNYNGVKFPSWMGDPLFSNLASIELYNCRKCKHLPPFGQLPFLKHLYMGELYELEHLSHAFCGHGEVKGFPSLEILTFCDMPNFEKWCGVEEGEIRCLRQLTITNCPKLKELPHLFPTIKNLKIRNCNELISLPRLSSLRDLVILEGCNEMVLSSVPYLTSLSSLTIYKIPKLIALPKGMLQPLTALKELRLEYFDDLVSWQKEVGLQCLTSLEHLVIRSCPQLISLPNEGLPGMLAHLTIANCPSLKLLPKGLPNLTSLQRLQIWYCPQLSSFPEKLPTTLQSMAIIGCPLLKERCQEGSEDWPKIAHIPDIVIT